MRARYTEYQNSPVLEPYVECFWSLEVDNPKAHVVHWIIPDGCVDVVFDLTDSVRRCGDLVGTMTRPLVFQSVGGRCRFVGLRFRPGGAFPFFRCPMSEVTDTRLALSYFWQSTDLYERMMARGDSAQRIEALSAHLEDLISDGIAAVDPRITAATAAMQGESIPCRIESVSNWLGLSRQHLSRLFKQHVGIGPKTFSRVMRVRCLLGRTKGAKRVNWASEAVSLGFYDQPHMISECKALLGMTPREIQRPR